MGSLVFRITGDPSAFKAAMGEVSASLDGAARRAETVSQKMSSLGTTLSLGVTLPALALGRAVVGASANMDGLRRALESTTGSSKEAAAQLQRLEEIAKLPGIDLPEAVRGSIRLQNYGLSAGLAEKALRAFSNAVAAGGGTAEDTSEALRQLGQMYGRGRVTMDNLRIILERVPQAAKIIRDEWGSDALADPAKAFANLGINASQMIETLIDRLLKLNPVQVGLKTGLENLQQEITKSAARIGDKLTPAIIELLPKLEKMAGFAADAVDAFTKLPEPLKNTALAATALVIAAGPAIKAFGFIKDAIVGIQAVIGTTATGLAGLFGGAFVIGIGQALTLMDELKAKTKAINEERAAAASKGGLMANGLAPSRESLQGVKVDVKALADELDLYGTKAKAASESAKKAAAAITDKGKAAQAATNIIKVSSVEGLIYVESLERVKTAVSKIKDVMYEWSIQGTSLGKMLEYHRAPLDNLAIAADDYRLALSKARFELEALGKMPAIQMATPTQPERRGTILEAGDILRDIGGSDPVELRRKADQAAAGYERLIELQKQGKATAGQVKAAYEAWHRAERAATGQAAESAKAQAFALRQVSTVITDLSRGIARSIIEWKGWGEMLKGVAKSAGEAIIRELVEKALTKLAVKLLDVGGIMGKVFGGGTGAVMSAVGSSGASAAGSVAGSVGGIGGSAGRIAGAAASTGVSAAVGMVTGAISAVSGIIGNFQMMGMNKTLDLIEKEVRYSQIHLLNLLEKNNEYLPNLKNIWESLIRMETRQMSVAGGGGLVINITGNTFGAGTSQAQVKALFTAAVNEMKLKGLTK